MFKMFVLFMLMQAEQPLYTLELEMGDRFANKAACEQALDQFENRWRESNNFEGVLNWRWVGAECIDVGAPA